MQMDEEKRDGQQMVIEYATILWHRKFWLLLPLLAAVTVSVSLIFSLPKRYLSTTMILVEGQKIPEEFVRSTVSEPMEGRLSTIRQQIMSRSFLQKIIDQFGLYKKNKETDEEKVEGMRKDIEIKTVGGTRIDAFSISFLGHDPLITMKVTNELASLFIKENLKIREQLVEGTTEFIDSELETLKKTLEQQESSLSRFKQSYAGELPGQLDASLRSLDRLQLALQTTKASIKAMEVGTEVDPLFLSWKEQKQKLAALQRRYRDTHPDVLALKKEVKELEDRVVIRNSKSAFNREKQVSVFELQDQSVNATELSEMRERAKRIEDQIRDFERRVENVPRREQQLAILLRDYDNTKENYQKLLDKKLTAKISENLEKRQKGEQFRILDPANFPEKPYAPNPLKIAMLGSVLGIIVGTGLVFLREMMDVSIRKPEELEKMSSIPVLASILDYKDFPRRSNSIQNREGKTKPSIAV